MYVLHHRHAERGSAILDCEVKSSIIMVPVVKKNVIGYHIILLPQGLGKVHMTVVHKSSMVYVAEGLSFYGALLDHVGYTAT